ncbi:amidohydrolase [Polymorphobacter sp.]|uniref:amidohydrolase n=1 Tax=Polymorphobacter sp. TaxID=1909290 RepID=UPI003F70CB18
MSARLILAAALASAAPANAQGVVVADTIIRNARIVTQDAADRTVPAIAIRGDQVLAAGTDREIAALKGANSCVIDAGGRTIVPGFADGHVHSKSKTIRPETVDLTPVKTLAELVARIEAQVKKSAPGEIIVTNADWHEAQLAEQRLPSRWDLDPISPNNPVVVIRGGHQYVLNSNALAKWNITKSTVSPPGGAIVRAKDRDDINGELVDRARDLVIMPERPPLSLDERVAMLKAEQARYNSLGLTSVRNPGASLEDMRDYQELAKRGDATIRTSVLIRWDRKTSAADFRKQLDTWPMTSGFGDKWVRLDGIKLGVDGGYEGGWMTQPYAEPYGQGGKYFGLNTVPGPLLGDVVKMLNQLDLRPSTHAVGDAAVDLVLDAYEAADKERAIDGRRWAIEHAFITRPDQIERIKRLGIIISAQSHLYLAGSSLIEYWGRDRAEAVAPVRTWLDAGIHVAGGTDNKLPYYPESPLLTFIHWVTRDTASAGVLGKDQAITRKEALRLATIENAYLTFEEDIKGRLAPGQLADLVVLNQDIMTVPDADLPKTEVVATMVGGKLVFGQHALACGK